MKTLTDQASISLIPKADPEAIPSVKSALEVRGSLEALVGGAVLIQALRPTHLPRPHCKGAQLPLF